jgi:glycerate kinase
MVAMLDQNLAHFADVVARDLGCEIRDLPGAGAAGGLGGGLVAFASGRLEPGVSLIIRTVRLDERLRGADLCMTGEGAIDASSAFGKTAVGVARLARSLGCPTFALAGALGPGHETVLREGVDAVFTLCPGPISTEEATERAAELLERAAEQAIRAFLAGRQAPPPESGRS